MATTNYVKFMRGTPKAYELLSVKDNNTLYFIAEENALSGKLYLGAKEIVCDNQAEAVSYLKDLLDVSLPEDVSELLDGQVLTYDVATEKWVARTPESVAEVVFDKNQFETNENGELSILNFANAASGAQLTKSADGSLIWVLPDATTVEGLTEIVETLRTDVDVLNSKFDDYDTSDEVDTKIASAIASANHLSYKTVNSTDEIDLTATDADLYIYLVKNGDVYDEYMVIDNKLEKVGDWSVSLDDYATKTELSAIDSKVEDLATQLNASNEEIATIKDNIGTINTSVEDLTSGLQSVNTQVTDLASQLNAVQALANANKASIETHDAKLVELETALADKVDTSVYDAKMAAVDTELAEMKSAMTWNYLSEEETETTE